MRKARVTGTTPGIDERQSEVGVASSASARKRRRPPNARRRPTPGGSYGCAMGDDVATGVAVGGAAVDVGPGVAEVAVGCGVAEVSEPPNVPSSQVITSSMGAQRKNSFVVHEPLHGTQR